MANDVEGIPGSTLLEPVHVNGQGTYQDGIKHVHVFLGVRKTKKAEKETLDLLFKAVASNLSWCAERGFPIFANRFGPMDLSRKTATETQGNYYVIFICLNTKHGRRIMAGSSLDEEGICLDDVILTMSLALAYDEWTKDRDLRRWEVDNAEDAVVHLMQCMINYLSI